MNEERRDISRDDRATADDALMDALLAAHFEPDAAREERIARAFAALDAERDGERDGSHSPRRTIAIIGGNQRRRLLPMARAAMIVLALGALFLLFPYETNASNIIRAALRTESSTKSSSGSRRYEIRVVLPPRADAPRGPVQAPELVGTWDLRGDSARLDLAAGPHGSTTRASSPDGAWERAIDGTVRALDSRVLWPRWIEDPSGEVAIERMDALLRLVQRSYLAVAARAGDESPAELRGSMHIVATRAQRALGPDDIELWIDTDRNVVLAARLAWIGAVDPRGGPRGPRGPAPGDERPPREDRPLREDHPPREGMPPRGMMQPPPGGQLPPPMDDYRPARGMLPPIPPRELHLRRIEPIEFAADHFTMPADR